MHRLKEIEEGCFQIDHPLEFRANGYIGEEDFQSSFDFAYAMTFGNSGHHRSRRSGGQLYRKNGEMFIDAFQGKLSEYAFYNLFRYSEVEIDPPDTRVMGVREWDSADFIVNGMPVAIKSTKSFGNLLLLETKDWDDQGRYIPNIGNGISEYDFFVLIRIDPDGTSILKEQRMFYSDYAEIQPLYECLSRYTWKANLAGYITRIELIEDIIDGDMVLPKNSILNGRTRMDAENYYVQARDLHPMSELISYVRAQ